MVGVGLGQVVAWATEALRRGPYGIALTRALLGVLAVSAGIVQLTHHTTEALDKVPTVRAGDTVIAVAALVYAITHDVNLMAEIANIAGGLVCEEVGTVAIDKQKLLV